MATRPWVIPQEVRDYTEHAEVQGRSDERLAMDIMRAEQWVIAYTRNDFSDPEKFPTIPESVRLAVILIAEVYAFNAASSKSGRLKSESFDDYSYTLADSDMSLDPLLLGPLLDEYVLGAIAGAEMFMRMRKL